MQNDNFTATTRFIQLLQTKEQTEVIVVSYLPDESWKPVIKQCLRDLVDAMIWRPTIKVGFVGTGFMGKKITWLLRGRTEPDIMQLVEGLLVIFRLF